MEKTITNLLDKNQTSLEQNISPECSSLDSVIYECTTDLDFLKQYYKIREECYRQDLGLKEFSGDEDEYDRIGHIVIARLGEKVIGGARLVIRTPNSAIKLPLEEDGFVMTDLFPELSLEKTSYCEITRFAITTTFRDKGVFKEMTRLLLDSAARMGCYYQFSIAPLAQARTYKIVSKQLGYMPTIRTDITVPYKPIYNHINEQKICLSITRLLPETTEINKSRDINKVNTKENILETI